MKTVDGKLIVFRNDLRNKISFEIKRISSEAPDKGKSSLHSELTRAKKTALVEFTKEFIDFLRENKILEGKIKLADEENKAILKKYGKIVDEEIESTKSWCNNYCNQQGIKDVHSVIAHSTTPLYQVKSQGEQEISSFISSTLDSNHQTIGSESKKTIKERAWDLIKIIFGFFLGYLFAKQGK
jgi:hypothetical protein